MSPTDWAERKFWRNICYHTAAGRGRPPRWTQQSCPGADRCVGLGAPLIDGHMSGQPKTIGALQSVRPPRPANLSPTALVRAPQVSLRYIGSKARVVGEIGAVLGPWSGRGRFVDAFCGTGIVAREAANLGWPLVINDHLTSSVAMAVAQVLGDDDVRFLRAGGYTAAVAKLNSLVGIPGFVWREYSPASAASGVERRYFTEANASRIDAIRARIRDWLEAGLITMPEAQLLIADLLCAANGVANIAGTYGCFMRHWNSNAIRDLRLDARVLPSRSTTFEASCRDVFDVDVNEDDTVYLDPPYTKRQYAAYYHVLETIAEGDEPCVGGITGLRPWEHKASLFCYKTQALEALVRLLANLEARRVLVSYSDEGFIQLDELKERLAGFGWLHEHRLGTIGRYRPNGQAAANGSSVSEYLLDFHRAAKWDSRPNVTLARASA